MSNLDSASSPHEKAPPVEMFQEFESTTNVEGPEPEATGNATIEASTSAETNSSNVAPQIKWTRTSLKLKEHSSLSTSKRKRKLQSRVARGRVSAAVLRKKLVSEVLEYELLKYKLKMSNKCGEMY